MFSSGPNYTKLKTNLRLAINRLKLIEKKKTELAQKSRKEIADYIQAGKTERAKIRVECIIREDYLVEAMELVEMFCDLILARFGLVQQMKELDSGLAEAVSSILWVAPRLQSDIQEMKIIADLLTAKYGKQYYEACRSDNVATINEKLKRKISVSTPPKILVEKYMIEIAKNYDILYEPDPEVMKEDTGIDALLNLADTNDLSGGGGGGMGGGMGFPQPAGFIGYPQPPLLPQSPNYTPFNYPPQINSNNSPNAPYGGFVVPGTSGTPNAPPPSVPYGAPYSYNIPPHELEKKDLNTNLLMNELPPKYDSVSPDDNSQNLNSNNGANPKPQPRSKFLPDKPKDPSIPDLPSVPSDLPDLPVAPEDEVDFDDLTRRFEELKKKK